MWACLCVLSCLRMEVRDRDCNREEDKMGEISRGILIGYLCGQN